MKKAIETQSLEEASTGLEPVNDGFAIRCLSHLATTPLTKRMIPDAGVLARVIFEEKQIIRFSRIR